MIGLMKQAAVVVVALSVWIATGTAEPVRIGVDAVGHGWLFGDDKGACWVAAPLHVVGDKAAGTAEPFVFYTQDLQEGGTDVPVPVTSVPAALAETGGQEDLAFAKVAYGPADCRSGLGLNDYVYRRMLERSETLRFVSMLPSSAGFFDAVPTHARADAGAGLVLRLRPRRDEDFKYLMPGLSGSVGTVTDTFGGSRPFAMALSVSPDQTLTALRFDAIAKAFTALEGRAETAPPAGLAILLELVALDGASVADDTGVANVLREEGCFRAVPAEGERFVRIVVEPATSDVSAVRLIGVPDCGASTKWIAEYRTSETGNWRGGVACTAAKDPGACRLGRSGVRQIRLTAAEPGEAALQQVVAD